MTVEELARLLDAQLEAGEGARSVRGALMCDIMSRAMAHGFDGMAWITHQANINALAVAVIAGAACIVFPDGLQVAPEVEERAKTEGVALLTCSLSAFEAAGRMWQAGLRGEAKA